jgi:hypothetical protein
MANYTSSLKSSIASLQQLGKLSGTTATQTAQSLNPLGGGLSPTLGLTTPTSNVTADAAPGSVPLTNGTSGSSSNPVWVPNVLSTVEQPAYHIRFFITEDKEWDMSKLTSYSSFRTMINGYAQTTIAETGITGLNIQSLTMDTIAGPNENTRSFTATGMTMVITEPMGVSFFDLIVNTASELSIRNFSKFYYFVEITFKGYSSTGIPTSNVCTNFPSNKGSWLYQVSIVNIDVDSNSTGSTYTLKLMPHEEDSTFNDDNFTLADPFTPQATTVSQTLTALANALNKSVNDNYGVPLTTYNFTTVPVTINGKTYDPSTWKVSPTDIDYSDQRSMAMDTTEGTDKGTPQVGYFARGTKIGDVLDAIIQSTQEARNLAKDVQQIDEIKKTDGSGRNSTLFRYEPLVVNTDYDYYYQRYRKNITINIKSFYTTRVILNHDDINLATDKTYQQTTAATLNSAGYMCKRYDYMFTGLNTEVLNFDFKFNFAWDAVLPRLAGFKNSLVSTSIQAKVNPNAKTDNNANPTTDVKDPDALAKQLDEAKQKENAAADANAEAQKNLANLPATASTSDRQAAQAAAKQASVALQTAQQGLTAVGNVVATADAAANTAGASSRLGVARGGVKYAEDLTNATVVAKFPLSISQAGPDSRYDASGSYPEHWTRDRAIFASIINQMSGPVTTALANITLEIKGDPYWMGDGNVARMIGNYVAAQNQTARNHMSANAGNLQQLVDYSWGDCMFLLAFKVPTGLQPDGTPILSVSNSFTGIYRAVSINHSFSGGVFKQTLSCQRMELMDPAQAFSSSVLNSTASSVAANNTVNAQAQAQNGTAGTATASAMNNASVSNYTPTANPMSSSFIPASMSSSIAAAQGSTTAPTSSLFSINGGTQSQFSINPPPSST